MSTQRDLHTSPFKSPRTVAPCQSLAKERKTNFKSLRSLGYVRETFEFFACWDRKELYAFETVSIRILQNIGYPLLSISESIDWFSNNLWKIPTNDIKYRDEEIQHHHSKITSLFGSAAPNFVGVQIFGVNPRIWDELHSELKTMTIHNETFQFHS